MKTIAALLLLATALGVLAQAPPAAAAPATEAEREANNRRLLDLIYAERDKSNAPARALPTRLRFPTWT